MPTNIGSKHVKDRAMILCGEVQDSSTNFLPKQQTEVSDQLHALSTLFQEMSMAYIGYEAG
jgi:hypothetical protein